MYKVDFHHMILEVDIGVFVVQDRMIVWWMLSFVKFYTWKSGYYVIEGMSWMLVVYGLTMIILEHVLSKFAYRLSYDVFGSF